MLKNIYMFFRPIEMILVILLLNSTNIFEIGGTIA